MHNFVKRPSRSFIITLAIAGIVGVGIFGLAQEPAQAFIIDWLADAAARPVAIALFGVIGTIAMVLGGLIVNLFHFVLVVGNYNQFLSSTAVTTGWVVIRDLVNMFFVLILIVIAIGTILQQQKYHYSQTLPKFLIMAVLVNFSKTICGIAIDASQVVMMTFMGAISGAAGGNFAALIGLQKFFQVAISPVSWGGTKATLGLVTVLIFLSIALIVVAIMAVMLTIRIVALWFLIILSPAAFFLMALPSDRGYSSKWMDQFINNLLLGPVLAFFLWLSLSVVARAAEGVNDARNIEIATELGLNFSNAGFWKHSLADLGEVGISTVGGMSGYILGIVMLMGSLMAAQQLSSAGGSIAGAGLGYFKDYWTGKRGPFNPIRTGRDVLGGLGQRWEKRRKERVERLTDAAQGAIGMIAKVPRGAMQAGLRRVSEMELPGGRRVGEVGREFYQQRIETPLDNMLQPIALGFGRPFRERIERQKTEAAAEKTIAEQRAGQLHAGADQVERGLHAMEIERDALQAQATAARRGGRIADATALDQQVADRNRSIAAGRANVNTLRTDADQADRQAQAAELRSVTASLRYGFARAFGQFARTATVGWAGYGATNLAGLWGTAAIHGPDIANRVGRFGEEEVVSANDAQSHAVDAVAKQHENRSTAELWEMLKGTKPGYNHTATERMGIMKKLMEKDEFRADQMEEVRHMFIGEGANGGTMDSIESLIRLKHPEQAARPLTVDQRRDLFRSRKIKPEDMTADRVTDQFMQDIMDPTVDQLDYFLKSVSGDVRAAMMTQLQAPGLTNQRQRLYREGKIKPEDLRDTDVNDGVVTDLINPDVAKLGDFVKKSTVPTRNAIRNTLRTRLDGMRAGGATVDAAGNLSDDFARELRHYAHAGGDMNEFFGLDADGGGTAAFTPVREQELNGLMRNIGSISAIGGFSNASMRNAASEVRTRLTGMDRASVSKLLKTGADGFAEQPRAASQIALTADALLAHAQAGAWGAGAPSDNIRTVIEQNA